MKEMKITYKNVTLPVEVFCCETWAIDRNMSLLKFYNAGICVAFVRLTEILKVVIN